MKTTAVYNFNLPARETEHSGPCHSSSHLESLLACAFQFDKCCLQGPLEGMGLVMDNQHIPSRQHLSFQFRPVPVLADSTSGRNSDTCGEARESTSAKNSRSERMQTLGTLAAGRIQFLSAWRYQTHTGKPLSIRRRTIRIAGSNPAALIFTLYPSCPVILEHQSVTRRNRSVIFRPQHGNQMRNQSRYT